MINATSWAPTKSLEDQRSVYQMESDFGKKSGFAFYCLLILIFVIYVGPQILVPALEPLHLAFVAAVLSVVAYSQNRFGQGMPLTILDGEVKLLLWLVAIALVTIPISKWPGGSVQYFLDQYSKSLIVFFLVANLLTSFKRFHQLFWCIGIFSAFNAGMGIQNYLEGSFYSQHRRILGGVSGIASNPNDLALTLNLAIPLVLYLYTTTRSRLGKWVAIGILAMAIGGILVSFSRGGFVTLAAQSVWFSYIRAKQRGSNAWLQVVSLVFVGFLLLYAFGPEGYVDRISTTVDTASDKTGSARTRWEVMVIALQSVVERPFGAGLHMNNLSIQEKGLGWSGVHNAYLECAVDLGVIGGGIFLVLLWRLLAAMRGIRSSRRETSPQVALLARAGEGGLLAFAVAAMFHPVAFHFYFYIVAGIAVAIHELKRRTTEESGELVG